MRANGFFSVTPTLTALNASRTCLRAEFHRCRNFDTEVRFDPAFDRLEARSISRKTFKSIQLAHIMRGESGGGRIARKQPKTIGAWLTPKVRARTPKGTKWSI
jgi:hypothetical protein